MVRLIEKLMNDSSFRKKFGSRIKELRKQKRWSQKELANKVGITFHLINKYEGGQVAPPIERLSLIAESLNTTVDYLLTGTMQDDVPLHDRKLLKMFKLLEAAKSKDKEMIINLIDAVILKSKVESFITD